MAKTILVMFPLEEGKRLIDALEQEGIPLKAALWLYFDEADEWRLVLASPLIDTKGPRHVYERIQAVLDANKENMSISLSDISLLSPDDPIIKPLTEALNEKVANEGMRVKKSVITGKGDDGRHHRQASSVYLEDAYIYFARK